MNRVLKNISLIFVMLTLLIHPLIAKSITTYCDGDFDMYKLWNAPKIIPTTLVTQVCCGVENIPPRTTYNNVINLLIKLDIGSSIKITNKKAGTKGSVEIKCEKKIENPCIAFPSLYDVPVDERGFGLRIYKHDIEDNEVTFASDSIPFFRFSKVKGNISVVDTDDSNLLCRAKSETNHKSVKGDRGAKGTR